jgi:uncharacterized protein (TIGR03089 family)
MPTPADLLSDALRRDGARPFLTAYDDGSGERVELSVATTANWVAKTANFLVEEIGVEPGETVGVMLPLHWQTAIVLLACWSAGAVVAWDADPSYALAVTDLARRDAALERLPADRVVTLSLAPMGIDFSRLVAAQPDAFVALDASGADVVEAFASPDLADGARVMSVLGLDTAAGLAGGLIGPLAAGGSVVQVRDADPARLADRCVTERVTHAVGVTVPGVARLDLDAG